MKLNSITTTTTATTSLFFPNPFTSQTTNKRLTAKKNLLTLISDQDRGLKTQNNPTKLVSIVTVIDSMVKLGIGTVTTGDSLSTTSRLLWTTEKEQLFIIKKAGLFGTKAGDVLQVIDVKNLSLNNVITFPPDGFFFFFRKNGVFFVRSNIEVASEQRVNFK
jgi:hypothetical protein